MGLACKKGVEFCVTPKSAAELSSGMSKRNVSLMPAFDETEGHYRKGLTANYRGLSRPKRPRIGQGTKWGLLQFQPL